MATSPTAAGLLLLLLPFLLLASSGAAHNITRLLEEYPDFIAFSSFLTQTKVADKINARTTITVLALDNATAGSLSGQPADVLEHILSVHVILDYYDAQKIHKLSKKSAIVTTLFQSSGLAAARTGFLNVTDLPNGHVAFGSAAAAPGSDLTSNFVKEVATKPYNISVLQVSGVIYPPGINGLNAPPPPPPAPAATPPVGAPKKSLTPAAAPAKSVSPAPSKAKAHAEAPVASSPAPTEGEADGPAMDAPMASPPSPTDSDAEAPAPEAGLKQKSSAGRVVVGASLAVVMGAALLGAI